MGAVKLGKQEKNSLAQTGRNVGFLLHQLRSPVTAIGILARSLQKQKNPGKTSRTKIEQLVEQTEILERLLNDALAFVRPHSEQVGVIDLRSVLRHVTSHSRPRARRAEVSLKTEIAKDLPPIRGRANLLREAFINLIENAVDATKGTGGTVRLMARAEKDTVIVDVTDTGKGMGNRTKEHAFSPFFSTKEGGTGLGLAFVRKVIEEHGGEVSLRSERDKGTRATVRLPVSNDHGR